MIHIGQDKDGNKVEIPVFHFGCFGQSGVGKTKLLKYMLSQVIKEDYRAIIFDSKVVGPEFEGIGTQYPFFLQESTDPDVFRSLIEGMRTKGRGNMERYRGGFIEICQDTKSFADIGKNLESKLSDKKIRGYTKQMYAEIKYDFDRLIRLMNDQQITSSVEFDSQIMNFPTWKLPNLALQGLVVRSVIEEALKVGEKIVFIIDEAPNFCHQRRYNPAKDSIQILDAQGRRDKLFGWYSGQTLTGFDKANMKNLWYWAVGREMEVNEAKDAYDTQTTKILTVDEIRKLKVREFLVITPESTQKITVPEVRELELFGETPRGSGKRNVPSFVGRDLPSSPSPGQTSLEDVPSELVARLDKLGERYAELAKEYYQQ